MSNHEHFDRDEYQAELECMDDEELFSQDDLEALAETRMNALVEQYEEDLDDMDMSELYGAEGWESLRTAKIEELIQARMESLGQDGE